MPVLFCPIAGRRFAFCGRVCIRRHRMGGFGTAVGEPPDLRTEAPEARRRPATPARGGGSQLPKGRKPSSRGIPPDFRACARAGAMAGTTSGAAAAGRIFALARGRAPVLLLLPKDGRRSHAPPPPPAGGRKAGAGDRFASTFPIPMFTHPFDKTRTPFKEPMTFGVMGMGMPSGAIVGPRPRPSPSRAATAGSIGDQGGEMRRRNDE